MEFKKVIYSGKVTIVLWSDNTKTVVRCGKNDVFDKEKGFLMALFQKITGYSKKETSTFFEKLNKISQKKEIENKNEKEAKLRESEVKD